MDAHACMPQTLANSSGKNLTGQWVIKNKITKKKHKTTVGRWHGGTECSEHSDEKNFKNTFSNFFKQSNQFSKTFFFFKLHFANFLFFSVEVC